jgi:hypothetical protein
VDVVVVLWKVTEMVIDNISDVMYWSFYKVIVK